MELAYYLSALSLLVIMLLSLAGIFLPDRIYNDSLPERVGLSMLFMFSLGRFNQLVDFGMMTGRCLPVSTQLCGHAGIAMIMLCQAYRAIKRHRRPGGQAMRAR